MIALFSSAADTFVFSFLIRRFLFREGRSTTEMLPAKEAWRISGEGLFTGVRRRRFCELRIDGVLRSLPLAAAVCTPGLYLPVGMDAGVRQRTMGPWVT